MSIVKCNCYDKVPKYRNPWAFHCQDLIGNIRYCLFWAINVSQCKVCVCRFSERVRRALVSPKTGRLNGRVEINNCNACWTTQFLLLFDILILRDQLHVNVNVPLVINSVDYTYHRNDLFFVTQCLLLYLRTRNGFLNKKNNKLTCRREPHDQTVNRNLVVGWG